jgi:type II secretory pathway component PulL
MKKIGFIELYDSDIREKLTTNSGFNFSLYVFHETKNGYELFKRLEDLKDESLKGIEHFYLSIPVGALNFRILEFPFADREKIKKVIPFELGNLILGGIESVIYDFTVLDALENSNKTLITYIDKKIIGSILERFKKSGIDIYVITSLELRHILEGNKEDFASMLVTSKAISEEEKIKIAMSEINAPTINLRTGEFAYTKDVEKSSKMLKLMLALLICLAIVINANLAFRIITSKSETSSLKGQMRTVYSTLFPADKKITDELYQMKSHMKSLKEKSDILIGINPLDLMVNLSEKKPKGIVFDEISLDRDVITLKGEAVSMSDLDVMKKGFSEIYSNVSVSDIKPVSENKILFTLITK